jgi:hypothetical protein
MFFKTVNGSSASVDALEMKKISLPGIKPVWSQ